RSSELARVPGPTLTVVLSFLMNVDPVTGNVALTTVSAGTDRARGAAPAGPAVWTTNAVSAVADRKNVKNLRMLRCLRSPSPHSLLASPYLLASTLLSGNKWHKGSVLVAVITGPLAEGWKDKAVVFADQVSASLRARSA